LFIRLASSYGDEAIVQIHNRVLRKPGKSEPPAPLPEDPSEANRIITLLGLYFKGEVLPAIEKIRGRGDEGAARAGSAVSELDAVVGPTAELVKIGAAKRATAEVKMDALDLNALPSIQHRRFVPMPVLILWHRIRLIFRGLIDRLIRRWQAKEPLKLTDFYNREGARVKAYLDYPEKVDDPRNVPWVIIPPAFGKTKETSFLLSLYLKKNGFGALRYDDSCSVGESEGEIYDLTLSGSTANILAAVDYLSINIKPRSIGLVPFSLSARPAIKAASLDERINFLLPIVGSPNVESLLSRVYGENLVGDYQAGVRKGALNLLGHIVDSDKFLGDTARAGYAGLASTLSDMNNVKIPIIWSCGSEDPWVDVAEVQQVLNVNPAGAQREIKTYRGLSHRVREAGKAPEIFAEVVRQIISLATGQAVSSDEIIHPQDNEIVKRGVLERHRISRRLSREEEVHNWNKYLEGFDILLETRDYMDYLELMWKHLEIRPGDNVLDVGCGNGNFLTLSLDRMALQMDKSGWSRGVMTGVDFVEEALGRAAQRIDKIKVKRKDLPALELQKLDVEQGELPHQHEFYDKIVASLFLSYLQKPEEAVKKICERLKKGGSIVLTSLKPDADVSQIYFRFMEKLKADHPRADQKEMIERARNLLNSAMGWIEVEEESGRFKYLSAAELENMLRANGIEIVASTRSFGDQAVVVVGKKPL
ncbi:MAG: methyltransferase domain-containing protein, partial [Patescibacteria group bacterium]